MPLVSLVENMAYFDDPSGGRHHPFGSSQLAAVRADAGLEEAAAFRLPIDATLTDACDAGVPLVVGTPDAAAAAVFDAAAARLVPDLLRLQHGGGGGGGAADAAGEAAVRVVWAEAVGGGETVVSHAEVRERAGEE